METKKGYKAVAKYLMVSPSKVRPVADLVRGKGYVEAVAILEAMPQKGSKLILKVLKSAGANALNQNSKLDEEFLSSESMTAQGLREYGLVLTESVTSFSGECLISQSLSTKRQQR